MEIPGLDTLASSSPALAALVLVVGFALLVLWRIWRRSAELTDKWFSRHEAAEAEQFKLLGENSQAVAANTAATERLAGILLDRWGELPLDHFSLNPVRPDPPGPDRG